MKVARRIPKRKRLFLDILSAIRFNGRLSDLAIVNHLEKTNQFFPSGFFPLSSRIDLCTLCVSAVKSPYNRVIVVASRELQIPCD
jgi:hypothetical protein